MAEKSAINILVLDDEPLMLKLLGRILTNLGFTSVSTSANGHAALASLDGPGNHPDLILLDLNMPEMDGVEFVRHLVERRYAGSLILVSGEDERMLQTTVKLVQAHRLPVLGYLCKPVTPEGLWELLARWVPPAPDQPPPATPKIYSADDVRAAIVNGELINHYQPKVEAATGRVMGVESLVRWQHPGDGMVFPGQFIGVAEAHGLIDDLTRVVLTGVLNQARRWQEMGLSLQVAVNVSMDNLASLDFVDFVTTQAAAAGVAPEQVVLEVTESQLMRDLRAPLEILARLGLRRFQLSIDDFGTGHSSLAQLRDIPFGELKIDRSFVHGAWNNSTARTMFEASLNLARQLNMKAVAEGVEDQDDWDFVRHTKCDFAQGYFIARPMSAEVLPDWIARWQGQRRP
ncbi:EAL domain-containing protein [Desulfurivibrio sp. C05AmB]|uniref:EAL domain-containing response regulator n=1 Tax=Desulfurivibrio sp. C05AmB TaxID=3374371 RepID=UPI00376EE970